MTPRLVLIAATLTLFSASAQAEVCRLADGREISTNYMGDVTYPTELVGYRLRERDDLMGYELFRLWSNTYDVVLVDTCEASFDHGGDGFGPPEPTFMMKKRGDRGSQGSKGPRFDQGGRDSGGHCDNQGNDDSSCADNGNGRQR